MVSHLKWNDFRAPHTQPYPRYCCCIIFFSRLFSRVCIFFSSFYTFCHYLSACLSVWIVLRRKCRFRTWKIETGSGCKKKHLTHVYAHTFWLSQKIYLTLALAPDGSDKARLIQKVWSTVYSSRKKNDDKLKSERTQMKFERECKISNEKRSKKKQRSNEPCKFLFWLTWKLLVSQFANEENKNESKFVDIVDLLFFFF